jgi:hypothetical protein
LDRICIGLCGICFGAVNVNADLGTSRLDRRGLESYGGLLRMTACATMPWPVSTRVCPREPALDPSSGISFRAWKFRGLLPRTTIGAVVISESTSFCPLANVPWSFR